MCPQDDSKQTEAARMASFMAVKKLRLLRLATLAREGNFRSVQGNVRFWLKLGKPWRCQEGIAVLAQLLELQL